MSRSLKALAALAAVALLPAGVADAAKKKPSPAKPQFYVSLGDSYASGYQPVVGNDGNGFAYQVPKAAKARGYKLTLVNFGCGGATTTSLLQQVGCVKRAQGPKSPRYPKQTQIAAAERYLKKQRGKVGLITVSIGGNDVTACARAADAISCVGQAVEGIKKNVGETVQRLRKAAGPKVRIVGITYPDVILGEALSPDPARQSLANLSVIAFKSLINPALKEAYESVGGTFVDVTEATGAYGPMTETTTLAPYGTIPVPVAKVCQLTWYCEKQDIHARTNGYKLIADLVAGTLPKRR